LYIGDSIIVTVKTSPKVDLGPDKTFCTSLQNTLAANQPYTTCYWYSDKGLQATGQYFVANDTGTFWLKAIHPNGCTDSDTIHFEEVAHSIIPLFLASSNAEVGDTIQFTGLSYPEPQTYFWDFGDGASNQTLSPTHIYTYPGTFDVKLTVNNGACDASIVKSITIEGYNKNKHRSDLELEKKKYENISVVSSILYPNPNDGTFRYEIELGEEADLQVALFSNTGRLIDVKRLKYMKVYVIEYSLTDLPSGIYILKAMAGKTKKTYKMIINK
jgi:hypothetical protein